MGKSEFEAGEIQTWSLVREAPMGSELLVSCLVTKYLLSIHYVSGTEKKAVSKSKGLPSRCLTFSFVIYLHSAVNHLEQVTSFPSLSFLICEMKTAILFPQGAEKRTRREGARL